MVAADGLPTWREGSLQGMGRGSSASTMCCDLQGSGMKGEAGRTVLTVKDQPYLRGILARTGPPGSGCGTWGRCSKDEVRRRSKTYGEIVLG